MSGETNRRQAAARSTTARKKTARKKTVRKKTVRQPAARAPSTTSRRAATQAPSMPAPSAERRRHARTVCRRLARAYPGARCSLDHRNPLELLIATMLSAQCTDERVNQVTPALFRKYPTAEHYARVPQTELEQDIRSTGFYRNKARSIRGAAQLIADAFGGSVPDTMEALLRLPGVARKTANVVLGNAFDQASGVVVDTHVHRLARRLGLAEHRDPGKVERQLMALLPRREWVSFSHRLIAHGRRVCRARKPHCSACGLADLCPAAEL